MQAVVSELIVRLRDMLAPGEERGWYLLDGSSLELEASPLLRKAYPPAENQHGRAHWPVLRIVALHELETGLAEEPHWGPMYGSKAVSEQQLAERAMAALKPGSVVVGDRNFGVFSTAWEARQRQLEVVIRLTKERAYKVAGGPVSAEGEKSKQWLYLFTTLELPAAEVVALYGRRWNIETDLRSLKRTVRLQHIAARTEGMMQKELLTAVGAYNLVRAVMALAARRHHLAPRQLSFTFALNVVNTSWSRLQAASDPEAHQGEVFRLLDAVAQGVHPKRTKTRSFPRAAWYRRHSFPTRKPPR